MQNSPPLFIDSDAAQSARHGVIHECSDCGLFSRLARPVAGTDMCCRRCGNPLRRVKNHSLDNGLAWTIAAACFYTLILLAPMIELGILGSFRSEAIGSGPLTLDNEGYWALAAVIAVTTIFMPLVKILGTLIVLVAVRVPYTPRWIAVLYAMLRHTGPWVMIEVYLLGFLVAYSRLQALGDVRLSLALVGLVGLMVAMVAMDAAIDPEDIWEKFKKRRAIDMSLRHPRLLGCDTCHQVAPAAPLQACSRCGETLRNRKPDSLRRTWALTIAAALLYIPSNVLPVMEVTKFGKTQSYTILGGLLELGHVGLWPLAALVFIASIAIPVFKLAALSFLLIQTQRQARARLPDRTKLYRLIDFIGRWSMVDTFVVSILVALVRFGWLTRIVADAGAAYFCGVVVLTLAAVHSFDPRLMWDAAQMPRRARRRRVSPAPVSPSLSVRGHTA